MRGRVRTATGGEEAGHGAADINNNYWFEPLSVRDLSNLKITSEINYVRLISPGPRSVYRRGYYAGRRPPSIARVCVLTPPGLLLLSTLLRRPLRHRCPVGQVVLLVATPLTTLSPYPRFSSYRIMSSAPAHARYQRYYVEHSAVYEDCPSIP